MGISIFGDMTPTRPLWRRVLKGFARLLFRPRLSMFDYFAVLPFVCAALDLLLRAHWKSGVLALAIGMAGSAVSDAMERVAR